MVGYKGSIHYPNNVRQRCNHACIGTVSCEDPKYLLLPLIWASLYDLECYEVLKHIVTSPMSLENVA